MKHNSLTSFAAAALILCSSCQTNGSDTVTDTPAVDAPQPVPAAESAPESAPEATPEAAAAPLAEPEAPAPLGSITGTIVQTMDSGGYTYVLVDSEGEQVWAAAPKVAVMLGDEVTFDSSMPMADYYSRTLDRTFAKVYFVGALEPAGSQH